MPARKSPSTPVHLQDQSLIHRQQHSLIHLPEPGRTPLLAVLLILWFITVSCTGQAQDESSQLHRDGEQSYGVLDYGPSDPDYDRDAELGIEHGIVYYEEGRYAGWPANHGIWSWDEEIYVGFVEAEFYETEGFHTYNTETARNKYARSTDGGRSWSIEDAYEHGQTAWGHDNNISDDKAEPPVPLSEPMGDFTSPDFIMTFLRHNNHNGPSHFYWSGNRGEQWEGAYEFPNLGTPGFATRTDYIVDGEQEMSLFMTVAKENEREGRVVLLRTEDGGVSWEIVSWIGDEPEGFDIMSSSLRLSGGELLTTIRTRTGDGHDLMTAWLSEDNGETWEKLRDPVADTGQGGSPPALVQLDDGRLAMAYIYRSYHGSRVNLRLSDDNGRTWSNEIMLRGGDGANRDTGYPRMVQRPDGKLVVIYYWNNALQQGAQPYRYIASTTVDPDNW